jgi:protein-L-isoaspartate O-methyltransferase
MAAMLEVLSLREGLTVLEIGTGTGYNAALLCEIVRDPSKVYSIDIDPDNVEDARKNLAAAGYVGLTLECRDGAEGLAAHAPYDRIIATCSISEVPPSWIHQLRDRGVLVAPIWINGAQITPSFEKHGDLLAGQSTVLGGFMKIRPQTYEDLLAGSTQVESDVLISSEHPDLFPERDVMALLEGPRTLTRLTLEGLSPKMRPAFFIFLALREKTSVEVFLENEEDRLGFGDAAAGLIDCLRGSACLVSRDWSIVSYGHEYARRRVEAVAAEWHRLGRPGLDRVQASLYPRGVEIHPGPGDAVFVKGANRLLVSIRPTAARPLA